jgi:hypothetical protein
MIGDIFAVDSRIRACIRFILNTLAERSISRLRTRIVQLEGQRERYAKYMASDKALYLATFQGLLFTVICIALGAMCAGVADVSRSGLFKMWSIAFYGGAVAFGIMGVRYALLDSREKVAKVIQKIESDLAELKEKLADRLK